MFFGISVICATFQKVFSVQWTDLTMLTKGLKRFRQSRDKTGKHDFATFYYDFPSSTSQMIGDVKSPVGSVANALTTPALVVWMIGATCLVLSTARGAGYVTIVIQVVRLILPPTSLYIVLLTPFETLGRAAHYDPGQPLSEYSSAMDVRSWGWAHQIGANLIIFGVALIELPCALCTDTLLERATVP